MENKKITIFFEKKNPIFTILPDIRYPAKSVSGTTLISPPPLQVNPEYVPVSLHLNKWETLYIEKKKPKTVQQNYLASSIEIFCISEKLELAGTTFS